MHLLFNESIQSFMDKAPTTAKQMSILGLPYGKMKTFIIR